VGIDFDTFDATGPVRVVELLLDGALAEPVACGAGKANLLLLDTTPASAALATPTGVQGLAQATASVAWSGAERTSPSNHRSFVPVDVELPAGRAYRWLARVESRRSTPIAGPLTEGGVTVRGGVAIEASDACAPAELAKGLADPSGIWLAFRFRTEWASEWTSLGAGVAGALGQPLLAPPQSGEPFLHLSGAAPSAPVAIAAGRYPQCVGFMGEVLVPSPDVLQFAMTNVAGELDVPLIVLDGPVTYWQVAVVAGGETAVSNVLARRNAE
jgi:hypothetical protein